LYLTNNGVRKLTHDALVLGSFLGCEFLSIGRIMSIMRDWPEFSNDNNYSGSSFPKEAIKIEHTNPKWVALFADSGGNCIGLDFDPGNSGKVGQIINFGSDEDQKFIIAEDIASFFQYVLERVQLGDCDRAIVEEEDGNFSYSLQPQSHLIDDLKDVFGKL